MIVKLVALVDLLFNTHNYRHFRRGVFFTALTKPLLSAYELRIENLFCGSDGHLTQDASYSVLLFHCNLAIYRVLGVPGASKAA